MQRSILGILFILASVVSAWAQSGTPGGRPHIPQGTGCIYWLAPPAGGSVLIAGQPTPFQCDSRGNLRIANMDAAGNARGANVTSTFELVVGGAGTAGTASANVVTIQGIASMTKLLVTPDANSAVNVAQINGVTPLMGNGTTGTGSPRVTIASDGTAISTTGYMSVKLDQTTVGTTNAMSLAQIGATTVVNCGLAGCLSVGGATATNVAITDNPINTGFQAVSSENAAVTTARKVQGVADLVGKQIVLPYANPENFVSGVITSAMTGTTSTSLIAAPASGLRNYITQCTFSNSHATVGTMINIQDGNGGTTIYNAPLAPAYGGAAITFPTPLRQPTTATAIYVANVTTGSSTFAACSGYKGA